MGSRRCWWAWLQQGQPLPAGQRLEVVAQAVVAAVQEKQHARAARGALLEDVVVLQPVAPAPRRILSPPAR